MIGPFFKKKTTDHLPEIRGQHEDNVLHTRVVQCLVRLGLRVGRSEMLAQDFQRRLGQERQLVGHLLAVVAPEFSCGAVDRVLKMVLTIPFEIKFNLSSFCLTDPFYLLYLELLSFAPSLKVCSEAKSKPRCKLWSLR